MKDYPQIVNKMTSTPWFITESGMNAILEIMNRRLEGEILTKDEIRIRLGDNAGRERTRYSSSHRNVGILSLEGPMFPKANLFTELSGATSYEQASQELRTMLADDSIDSILLNFDSPGGSAEGVQELASEIFDARESGKRIVSMANFAANSAAYYLASQAHEMYATPSGQLGSVGVVLVMRDDTRADEMAGVDRNVITAGRLKAAGYTPMTPEHRGYLQDLVDTHYEDFTGAVARGRNTTVQDVVQNYGEGGIVFPKDALDKGMIDGIATFDEVLNDMVSNSQGGGLAVAAKSGIRSEGRINISESYDADKEHSEPGTGGGGEPTPREAPETGDPAIAGGWRRDTPPAGYEDPEPEERSDMNREWLLSMAAKLGMTVSDDTSDEQLAADVEAEMDSFVTPIQQAADSALAARNFAVEFPEQANELSELRETNKENKAQAFADGFRRLENGQGLSTLCRDSLKDAHLKIADRQFSHSDLETLVSQLTSDSAQVAYDGEKGSARREGDDENTAVRTMSRQEVRNHMASELRRVMEEDGLDRTAALNLLKEQNPELVAAYINSSSNS